MELAIGVTCLVISQIVWVSSQSVDEPLHLTPLIWQNRTNRARELSKVDNSKLGSKGKELPSLSHAGFLTVNETLGKHLFFWFFPSSQNKAPTPLVVWLNGGPGVSSMLGMAWENGPIEVTKESGSTTFKKRQYSWAEPFSMLYIDNPVGVGYSYSDSGNGGYRLTSDGYTEDLYQFMLQFLQIFPEYCQRELYLGGQSYAGKYVPLLAHYMHTKKLAGELPMPLTGIYLGGPFFDPLTQLPVEGEYLYALGAYSYAQKRQHQAIAEKIISDINCLNAMDVPQKGNADPLWQSADNYANQMRPDYLGVQEVMTLDSIRSAIHVGANLSFTTFNQEVHNMYIQDYYQSVKEKLAVVLDNYKVLIFTGDFDPNVSPSTVEAGLMTTPWSKQSEYNETKRSVWELSGSLRGFYSITGRFCRVTIHGAGHHIPHDQPESTRLMMQGFVTNGCVTSLLSGGR